jgi:hypothetical protein
VTNRRSKFVRALRLVASSWMQGKSCSWSSMRVRVGLLK